MGTKDRYQMQVEFFLSEVFCSIDWKTCEFKDLAKAKKQQPKF